MEERELLESIISCLSSFRGGGHQFLGSEDAHPGAYAESRQSDKLALTIETGPNAQDLPNDRRIERGGYFRDDGIFEGVFTDFGKKVRNSSSSGKCLLEATTRHKNPISWLVASKSRPEIRWKSTQCKKTLKLPHPLIVLPLIAPQY